MQWDIRNKVSPLISSIHTTIKTSLPTAISTPTSISDVSRIFFSSFFFILAKWLCKVCRNTSAVNPYPSRIRKTTRDSNGGGGASGTSTLANGTGNADHLSSNGILPAEANGVGGAAPSGTSSHPSNKRRTATSRASPQRAAPPERGCGKRRTGVGTVVQLREASNSDSGRSGSSSPLSPLPPPPPPPSSSSSVSERKSTGWFRTASPLISALILH